MSADTLDKAAPKGRLYRMLWRWHFYAGLFCIPFVIVLSISGSLYLFRPQIEDLIDRPYLNLERTGAPATQDAIVAAATGAVPGSGLASIVLPERPNQAARVIVSDDGVQTRVYVHPDTLAILKSVREDQRFRRIVFNLHGELLMGTPGTLVVELAASWAIVMVLTGLYLWWPRQARGLAGVLWPRLREGPQRFWRDLHAVTGVWVSAFALFLLVTGLPWALVWGEGLKQVRQWTSTVEQPMDWSTSSASEHAEHRTMDHEAMAPGAGDLTIDAIVVRATALNLSPPVLVAPPRSSQPYWSVKSDAANRPLRADVFLSPQTGEIAARRDFSDRHVIDQVVGFGVAAHEGQLFGPLNQALGLLTAAGLVVLSVSAFVLWRRRAPAGVLGAPPAIPDARIGAGLGALILVAAVLLPVLGISLVLVALAEQLVLRRWPAARRWLGLPGAGVRAVSG
jgi:uncharacterized iron-regulated membrane protein